jgi:hypothetical protein
MNNKIDTIDYLRREIQQLRERIESGNDTFPIEMGFPKLLIEIGEMLVSENLDVEKLKRHAYGIFRLVTESYEFEQSDLGKQLLDIRLKIKKFSSSYGKENN